MPLVTIVPVFAHGQTLRSPILCVWVSGRAAHNEKAIWTNSSARLYFDASHASRC
jgi:hypothetical protein